MNSQHKRDAAGKLQFDVTAAASKKAEELDEATKAIIQHWRRKNARRNGLILENEAKVTK